MKPGASLSQRRSRPTEYGRQLREKQKLKRFYGVWEAQFMRIFKKATSMKGNAGANLLILLERRLDNTVCLSGIASSRSQARQFINHGMLFKNGKRLDVASSLVKPGDEFEIRCSDKTKEQIKENLQFAGSSREKPEWIDMSSFEKDSKFRITVLPTREQISAPVNEQLVVELCSK
jgi:small subunit ribosomal protein S4